MHNINKRTGWECMCVLRQFIAELRKDEKRKSKKQGKPKGKKNRKKQLTVEKNCDRVTKVKNEEEYPLSPQRKRATLVNMEHRLLWEYYEWIVCPLFF